jgi:hypothetical protein
MGPYRTEFEVSYLSNGTLFSSLELLLIGGIVAVLAILFLRRRMYLPGLFLTVFSFLWLVTSSVLVVLNVRDARLYRAALRDGRCSVQEGIVQVVCKQPARGHAPGDRIRIGDREFQYSYFESSLAYNRTIAHGANAR